VDGEHPDDLACLVAAGLLDDVLAGADVGDVARIGSALAAASSREVVSRLNGAGVPAVAARKIEDLAHDEVLFARRVLQPVAIDHGGVSWTGPGRWWEVAGAPDVRDAGSSSDLTLGGATYEVLREIGLSDDEIGELAEAKAVQLAGGGPA
jgi:crotonobetainyl-CoA:carnitine CoA-transferase CaiB-like acyl-CoA transferase